MDKYPLRTLNPHTETEEGGRKEEGERRGCRRKGRKGEREEMEREGGNETKLTLYLLSHSLIFTAS